MRYVTSDYPALNGIQLHKSHNSQNLPSLLLRMMQGILVSETASLNGTSPTPPSHGCKSMLLNTQLKMCCSLNATPKFATWCKHLTLYNSKAYWKLHTKHSMLIKSKETTAFCPAPASLELKWDSINLIILHVNTWFQELSKWPHYARTAMAVISCSTFHLQLLHNHHWVYFHKILARYCSFL